MSEQSFEEQISHLNATFEEQRKLFMKQQQNLLKAVFSRFFEANPEIMSVYWYQYTPFFNDGDECIFSVYDMYFSTEVKSFSGREDCSFDDSDKFYGQYNEHLNPGLQENFDKFEKLIKQISDDVYKQVFGDHVEILATREGFEIEEYDHE